MSIQSERKNLEIAQELYDAIHSDLGKNELSDFLFKKRNQFIPNPITIPNTREKSFDKKQVEIEIRNHIGKIKYEVHILDKIRQDSTLTILRILTVLSDFFLIVYEVYISYMDRNNQYLLIDELKKQIFNAMDKKMRAGLSLKKYSDIKDSNMNVYEKDIKESWKDDEKKILNFEQRLLMVNERFYFNEMRYKSDVTKKSRNLGKEFFNVLMKLRGQVIPKQSSGASLFA